MLPLAAAENSSEKPPVVKLAKKEKKNVEKRPEQLVRPPVE